MKYLLITLTLVVLACGPTSITHVGPPLPPKTEDCDMEILPPEKKPIRPYRDVGLVTIKNCQDYQTNPCRKWLINAACRLGGNVAYLPEENLLRDGRSDETAGPITFRIMVGTYISELAPGTKDPVLNAQEVGCPASPPEKKPDEPVGEKCRE